MSLDSFPEQILPSLHCGRFERFEGGDVGFDEGKTPIWQIVFLAEGPNHWSDLPELAPRQPREQMVFNLKLEPPEEPIHPLRAGDVYRPARGLLQPIVPHRGANVHTRGEMVQAELDVLDRTHAETRKHEPRLLPPIRETGNQQREPSPEN
ncbi:unnamed protein product [Cuscuta epithymum]|uniref:Uncharacterized protein n=1 Tax=Cuscuta epithymum TaxID=186058 RepID=A0AAV0EM86_9ASTE|nr:unnamed protein product [Cuscuta epithymum]